jgi:hypothetical protein
MMQEILQQFAGGTPQMSPEQMYGHVDRMVQQAPPEHVQGAIGEALQALGPHGFGQSVASAAQGMGPQQQQGLVGLLGSAIEGGGGSLPGALSSLGIGGGSSGSGGNLVGSLAPAAIGALASYALQNHGGSLGSVLGNQASSGGSGVLSLLGNPMVQRVGMNLAQRMLSGQGL